MALPTCNRPGMSCRAHGVHAGVQPRFALVANTDLCTICLLYHLLCLLVCSSALPTCMALPICSMPCMSCRHGQGLHSCACHFESSTDLICFRRSDMGATLSHSLRHSRCAPLVTLERKHLHVSTRLLHLTAELAVVLSGSPRRCNSVPG